PRLPMIDYRAPAWLPGGNLQTIWPALFARRGPGGPPCYRRERWPTPDGDFIDVDWVDAGTGGGAADRAPALPPPLIVLFHGLEGSSASHYAQAFGAYA